MPAAPMSDLAKLLDAVQAMRAAQKLEWQALPSNFNIFKRARQQQTVSQLENMVDDLVAELLRTSDSKDKDKPDNPQ